MVEYLVLSLLPASAEASYVQTPHRSTQPGHRLSAIAYGLCAVLVAASVLIVLSVSGATAKVADNARNLHWTNAVLASMSIARAANSQALFFTIDRAAGLASVDAWQASVVESERAIEALDSVILDAPEGASETVENTATSYLTAATLVLEFIQSGDAESAVRANESQAEGEYVAASEMLEEEISLIHSAIAASEGSAGRVANLTEAVVTLLIPLASFGVYRMIVKRQLAERRIEFEVKLEAAQELNRSKDQFIAGVSHEFRTPLTAIFGFSELLIENGLVDPEFSSELVHLINSESAELSRMVEDVLTAARLEAEQLSIHKTGISLGDEVESVILPFLRSGSSIEIDLTDVRLLTDGVRFRQVLRNLVSNADKHGGSRIAIVGRRQADHYLISVIDDGDGVPDAIADRLFERFTHDSRDALLTGSVGLGLNIARELAEALGGGLTYDRVGESTVFTFGLPIESVDLDVRRPALTAGNA